MQSKKQLCLIIPTDGADSLTLTPFPHFDSDGLITCRDHLTPTLRSLGAAVSKDVKQSEDLQSGTDTEELIRQRQTWWMFIQQQYGHFSTTWPRLMGLSSLYFGLKKMCTERQHSVWAPTQMLYASSNTQNYCCHYPNLLPLLYYSPDYLKAFRIQHK